jgi:hypothetical protein
MNQRAKLALRSAAAVAAGYLTMAVLVMLLFLVLGIVFPKAFPANEGTFPSIPWIILILIWSLLAAMVGAYVTSLLCQGSRVKHVMVLLAVVVVLGFLFLAGNVHKQPLWYLIAQIVVGAVGVMIGGSVPVGGRESQPRA